MSVHSEADGLSVPAGEGGKTEAAGHTPRPWFHYDDSLRATPRHTVLATGKTVAHIYCTKGDEQQDAANARLIAAAPDMLEALRWAENAIVAMRPTFSQVKDEGHAYHDQVLDTVRAAIAKALGTEA